jgi:hypothetical protein
MGRVRFLGGIFRTFVGVATFLTVDPNLLSADDRKDISGFPASEFCFYGGRAYSMESRLCGGVAQLLTCKEGQGGYARWEVTPSTPEPCPAPPQALGLGLGLGP